MVRASEILADVDKLVSKYSSHIVAENTALKIQLAWAKQCFKQALEVLGDGENDARVQYLEHVFFNFYEE
jgi:hypothetical protein